MRGTQTPVHGELSKVVEADPRVKMLLAAPFYEPEDISLRDSLKWSENSQTQTPYLCPPAHGGGSPGPR